MPPTSSTSVVASIPRSLKISPQTPITRTHLLALYKEQLRVAHSFSSYNFKQYFIRKTRDKFRNELPSLLDGNYATAANGARSASGSKVLDAVKETQESDSIYAPTSTPVAATGDVTAAATPEERLRTWYSSSLIELGVMARSAVINRMYEAPRLVVEGRGRAMAMGGGGAGAEAGYGGAGQPADGQKTIPATPASTSS